MDTERPRDPGDAHERTPPAGPESPPEPASSAETASEDDFAALLRAHIARTGVAKAALARSIGTKPQYIREIETGRKPPPTLDKVDVLAAAFGLEGADRERFFARAREGRTKPESREYFRNMEDAFLELSEIFGIASETREQVRRGDFEGMVSQIREAFESAGKVDEESAFLPFLQVMRYRTFVQQMLDNFDRLSEKHSDEDLDYIQRQMLQMMERLVGLREGERAMSDKLKPE